MTSTEWVTLSYREYQQLQERLTRAESFVRDHPGLAQELQDLRLRAEAAEAARDLARAEAARLRAERLRAERRIETVPGSVLWQVHLVGQLLDLLVERFVPIGTEIRLQRCRVCDYVSLDREVPSMLDHQPSCPARQIFTDWFRADAAQAGRPHDEPTDPDAPG